MAAKRPTGELPKRLSKQAKLFKGDPNVSSAEAATYAGRNRDIAKKAAAAKPAKKMTAKPATKENLIQDITNRFRVTAREARDIVTAVGTLGKAVATPAGSYGSKTKNKAATIVKAAGDVAKQAGETATAATRGRSGTSAIKLNTMARGASGLPKDVEYKTGTKRKPGSNK